MARKVAPVTSSGTQAPPKPENTNIGTREKIMACSSLRARIPINSPIAEMHNAALNVISRIAEGTRR